MERNHFILFVKDQTRSRKFYTSVLDLKPRLDVPGMTEFELPGGGVLGLMPAEGISKLLGPALPDPVASDPIPRAELYLLREGAEVMFERALQAGGSLLSPCLDRDWGHKVGYCLDPDGHVLAFATVIDDPRPLRDDIVVVTKNLRLRPFRLSDAPDTQRLAGAREIAEMTAAIPHPYEDGMAEAWIASHADEMDRGNAFHWAVTRKPDGALIGAISLMDINTDSMMAELGYWIAVGFWGKGYCTEAARAVIDWAFESLGLNRVHAHHFSRNPSSGAVLKKIGMRHEGSRPQHFGRWGRHEDLELYGILRSDWLK